MKHNGLVSVFLTCAGAVAIAAGITSVAFAGIVGNMPRGVAVNERTGKVYVANSGDDTVAVIQGEAQRVLATVPVGFFPFTIAVNVETNRVYVVSMDSSVSVIDGVTNAVVDTIPLPPSSTGSGLAVDTQANRIYVGGDADITVIDGSDDSILTSFTVGPGVRGLAVHHGRNRLYVSKDVGVGGRLLVVRLTDNKIVARPQVGDGPTGIVVDPTNHRIYVADNHSGDEISLLDSRSLTPLPQIDVSCCPASLARNPRTGTILSDRGALRRFDTISFIDPVTSTIREERPMRSPYGLAADSVRNGFYVTNNSRDALQFFLEAELLKSPSFEELDGHFAANWARHNTEGYPLDARFKDPVDGEFAFQLTGAAGEQKYLAQSVDTAGPAGTILQVEGWSKSSGASPNGGEYGLQATLYFTDGTHRTWHLPFTKDAHDWEKVKKRIVAPLDFTRLVVRVMYENQTGVALFDDLHAWRNDNPLAP